MSRVRTAVRTVPSELHGERYAVTGPSLERFSPYHDDDSIVSHHDRVGGRPVSPGEFPLLRGLRDADDRIIWIDAGLVVAMAHRIDHEQQRAIVDSAVAQLARLADR